MNLVRLVRFKSIPCGSPIPDKRDRDRVLLCNNGTDLLVHYFFGGLAEPPSVGAQAIQAE